MTAKSYQRVLRDTLIELGMYYSSMSDQSRHFYSVACSHYFRFIPPLVYTDLEILNELKSMLKRFND